MTKETREDLGLFLGCAVFMVGIHLTFGVGWADDFRWRMLKTLRAVLLRR